MEFDVLGKILAPLLTGIAGILIKRYLEVRPKLITWLIHAAASVSNWVFNHSGGRPRISTVSRDAMKNLPNFDAGVMV